MTIEIVDFPIKNGDFPIAMLVYQRVDTIIKSAGSTDLRQKPRIHRPGKRVTGHPQNHPQKRPMSAGWLREMMVGYRS